MKIAYHLVPVNFKDLAEKTDKDFKDFVKDNCLHDKDALNDKPNMKGFMPISVPPPKKEFPSTSNRKSDILIQPISTEDKSSVTGTASIIEEFACEIRKKIPAVKPYLLFDEQKLQFDISEIRRRYIFAVSMQHHKKHQENLIRTISRRDKTIDLDPEEVPQQPDNDGGSDDEDNVEQPLRHLQTLRKSLSEKDEKFKSVYVDLKQRNKHAYQTTDAGTLPVLKQSLKDKAHQLRETVDQYKRTFLHACVEDGDHFMVTLLLSVGFNPNVEEGCGATPLVLAVIGNKPEICRTLVQHLADIDCPFFVRVPSPKQLATHLGYNHILEIFGTAKVDKKDETVWSSIYGQTAALSSENGKDDNANETEICEMLQGLDCSEH